jgi:hypothetical protein
MNILVSVESECAQPTAEMKMEAENVSETFQLVR